MIDRNKLKFTQLQQEILIFLFEKAGLKFNARRLAKNLNVSPTAIGKAIPKLKKNNLINVKKGPESKTLSIELNRENKYVLNIKRVKNLKLIYEFKLYDHLFDSFPGCTIILFGSFSRGEDIYSSDIDIAVIGTKNKNLDLTNYEKEFSKKINISYYSSFENIEKHIKNNLLSGILISGGIEL